MFGRFNEVDDKPDWREKLAEWRDSPLFILQRPAWLPESPAALFCLFLGVVLAAATVMYLVVPADALPGGAPGRWTAPVTTSTTSTTSTTTTTIAPATVKLELRRLAALTPQERNDAMGFIRAANAFNKEEAAVETILATPATPPSREWAYGFLCAVASVLLFVAAWFLSDRRGRIMFEK